MFNFSNYNFPTLGYITIPKLTIPSDDQKTYNLTEQSSSNEYLRALCNKGYKDKLKDKQIPEEKKKIYSNRIKKELETFEKLGFVDYVLLIYRLVKFCKDNGILNSPSRGSCGGSCVFWVIGCIGIDPIKHDLLFERFISADRTETKVINGITYLDASSLPDFDLDSMRERKGEINKFLEESFPNRTASIITFNSFQGKRVLKEVLKVVEEASEETAKRAADLIEVNFGKVETIEHALEKNKEFKKWAENHKLVVEIAQKISGLTANKGIHASGVLLTEGPIGESLPLELSSDKRIAVGYDMDYAQMLGIKVDNLGLKNLGSIKECLGLIGKELKDIDVNDPSIYQFLNLTDNYCGIFQAEENLGKKTLKSLECKNIEEIAVSIGLGRPGSYKFIDDYISNRNNNEKSAVDQRVQHIYSKTYDVLVWQEQIMLIAEVMANFSNDEKNQLRKGVAKKNKEKLKPLKEKFITRSLKNNYDKEFVEKVWQQFEDCGDYLFNKCLHPETFVEVKGEFRQMKKIKIGDKIKAFNPVSQKDEFVLVKNIFQNEVEIFEIELSDGRKIITSIDHKFLCENNTMRSLSEVIKNNLRIKGEVEFFKNIKGYNYKISNFGRVISNKQKTNTYPGKILKGFTDQDGYLRLQLEENGIRKKFYVHRLVAENFLPPNIENKETVNHKNGIKKDNRPENLEWSTWTENNQHAHDTGLNSGDHCRGEKASYSILKTKQVLEIKKLYKTGKYTQQGLGKIYGVSRGTIYSIIKGINWKHLNEITTS